MGLIPCALGGSAISEWDPDLKGQGGASLYGALLRRFQAAGKSIRGILWYQGEADARPPEAVPLYPARLERLVQALRRDLGDPELPFYFVQLGRMLNWTYYGSRGRTAPPRIEAQFAAFRHNQALLNRQLPHTVSDHRKTYFFGLSPTGHRSRQPRLWRGIGGNGSVQRLNRPQIEHRQRVGERRGAGELIVPPP